MKVICTGLQKTGTKSLCSALRILGYKVYDFEEQFCFIGDKLKSVIDNGCTEEKIRKIFKGVDATTDFPAAVIWEFIFKAFPDVKVVHMQRKSEDEWINSFLNQIGVKARNSFYFRILLTFTRTGRRLQESLNTSGRIVYGSEPVNNWKKRTVNIEMMKLKYRQHNLYVKQTVPKHQLLVFNLSDGWKPLCGFLNVQIPDQNFPHLNKRIFVNFNFDGYWLIMHDILHLYNNVCLKKCDSDVIHKKGKIEKNVILKLHLLPKSRLCKKAEKIKKGNTYARISPFIIDAFILSYQYFYA